MADKPNKENIKHHLEDMRSGKSSAYDLIEVLEGGSYINSPAFMEAAFTGRKTSVSQNETNKKYDVFSKKYMIELLKKYGLGSTDVKDWHGTEILLASYGLLAGYQEIDQLKLRYYQYAHEAIGVNSLITEACVKPKGSDIYKLMKKKEAPIIEKLAEKLAYDIRMNDGKLGFAEDVLKMMREDYPDGFPDELPFPDPQFVKQEEEKANPIDEPGDEIMPADRHIHAGKDEEDGLASTNAEETDLTECAPGETLPKNNQQMGNGGLNSRKSSRRVLFAAVLLSVVLLGICFYYGLYIDNKPDSKDDTVSVSSGSGAGQSLRENLDVNLNDDQGMDIQAYDENYYPGSEWGAKEVYVEDGQEYAIRFQISCVSQDKTAAENVKASFSIPNQVTKSVRVDASASATNDAEVSPDSYVNFYTEQNYFHLEYIPGSAVIYNESFGDRGHVLSDSIIGSGVMIGYDRLNGILPSGWEYAGYIVLRVKAVYDTSFSLREEVRLKGTKEWKPSVDAEIGDYVEFKIEYMNTSTVGERQDGVIIRDSLPDNLQYVTGTVEKNGGTTKLWNGDFSGGAVAEQDGSINGNGINIGDYAPGNGAVLQFTAEVVDNSLAKGTNRLINWVKCSVGKKTDQTNADVYVIKSGNSVSNP